jgi:hypothetical protein
VLGSWTSTVRRWLARLRPGLCATLPRRLVTPANSFLGQGERNGARRSSPSMDSSLHAFTSCGTQIVSNGPQPKRSLIDTLGESRLPARYQNWVASDTVLVRRTQKNQTPGRNWTGRRSLWVLFNMPGTLSPRHNATAERQNNCNEDFGAGCRASITWITRQTCDRIFQLRDTTIDRIVRGTMATDPPNRWRRGR